MKTKILSILALLLMTVTQGAWAQETLTVYDETGTSQHIPMHGYDFDSYTKSECIIPASKLTAMEGGTITAITFYVKEVDGMNSTFSPANQKVFLKEVSETTLGSSYSGMDDATVVFDGTLPMPTTGGYTITFSQGYTYNGGNLLIGVYNDAKGLYNVVTWYGNNNQSDRVSAYGYNYSSLDNVGFTKQNFLPKTTFTYNTPGPQGSWNYDYTGAVQSFTAPYEGTYTLEAWGAQGGNWVKTDRSPGVGGRGGYASGTVTLAKNQTIYIYVGGQGATTENQQSGGAGGWNGGGNGGNSVSSEGNYVGAGGGGGASHVSLSNAQVIGTNVTTLSGTDYLIVAGGGGGAVTWTARAGAGGGTEGGAGATTGGTSLSPWYNSTLSTGRNGYNAVDYSSFSAEGTGGGGGGYLGGNAGTVTSGTSNQDCGGCGGSSNYNSTYVSNFTTTSGVREGAGKVTITFLSGKGTQASPYLIASTTDWNNLVSAVNGGETYSGNYFKMTADVDASTMIGSSTETFKGNFDGDGYTLNLNINMTSSSSQIAAPFAYVVGGTIKNVKLTGTVSTAGMRSSSLIGYADNCTIRNCTSSVAISSSRNNDVDGGAFVACVIKDKTVTIEGCAFTGSITFSDAAGYEGGGFVGWMRSPSTVTLTDCLFAPSAVSLAKASPAFKMFAYDNAGTTLTLNNCYYNGTAACNEKITKQDGTMQARTIAAGDYVSTLSVMKGDGTEYDVSGITVYSGGIDFNDGSTTTFYGGSGQTVSLDLTAETRTGYQFKQYAASQGTLSGQTTNTPTLTMPAANSTANDVVTISAEYDPLYNATFADASDASNGWSISPTSGIVGSTVTVSYSGENKVKSVTVTKLALCSLSEVTSEHVGKIIGADGNVYASLAQAEKVTSAVGVLGKVTETGHGLIMSLEDAPKQEWATIDGWASASYAGTTLKVLPDDDARGSNLPSYTTLGSTTVSNWAVATRADYTAIFTNLGSTRFDSDGISYDENVNAYITDAGGTAISGENWSSTEYNDAKAWRFSYDNNWGARDKTTQFKVRPVLGF